MPRARERSNAADRICPDAAHVRGRRHHAEHPEDGLVRRRRPEVPAGDMVVALDDADRVDAPQRRIVNVAPIGTIQVFGLGNLIEVRWPASLAALQASGAS